MRRFDANDSKQFHKNAWHRNVLGHDEKIVWNGKFAWRVIDTFVVRVNFFQTQFTETRALESGAKLQRSKAFFAF